MKKILLIFLIIYPLNLVADERVYKLNKLFNDLRIDNKSISAEVEQKYGRYGALILIMKD